MYTGANTESGTRDAPPLPVAYLVVFVGFIVSFAALFYGLERLRLIPGFWLVISVSTLYVIALLYVDLMAYTDYYKMVGVQGRYILPLLPCIMVFSLLGLNYAMRGIRVLKLPIFTIIFVLYLNGAGVITHIMRSNCSWYWDNQTICQVNNEARSIMTPFVKEWWYDRGNI